MGSIQGSGRNVTSLMSTVKLQTESSIPQFSFLVSWGRGLPPRGRGLAQQRRHAHGHPFLPCGLKPQDVLTGLVHGVCSGTSLCGSILWKCCSTCVSMRSRCSSSGNVPYVKNLRTRNAPKSPTMHRNQTQYTVITGNNSHWHIKFTPSKSGKICIFPQTNSKTHAHLFRCT